MKHKLIWVDAFTDRKFGGNQCAVVFAGDALSDEQMLAVAKEMNLSETAFVVKSSQADFGARYFTPHEEIPLAGHPTVATIRALIEDKQIDIQQLSTKLTLELKSGVVEIEIIKSSEGRYQILMSQGKPKFLKTHERIDICELFGLDPSDLLPDLLPQTVSTGTAQLMVPVRNLAALEKAVMNVPAYKAYKTMSDFFSPHLFCLQGVTAKGSTFARHFGVPPDTSEDAFTGSATGGMAAYMWRYGLLKSSTFIAEQGHWMGRPGSATVEVVGDNRDLETVRVGGASVVVFKGEIDI